MHSWIKESLTPGMFSQGKDFQWLQPRVYLGLVCRAHTPPPPPTPPALEGDRKKVAREAASGLLQFGYPRGLSVCPTSVPQPPERPQIIASGSPGEVSIPTTKFIPSESFLCRRLIDAVIMLEGML